MAQHYRVAISGTLAGGTEDWSTGFWYTDPDQIAPPEPGSLQAWAAAIVAGLSVSVNSGVKNALSTSGKITRIDTYWYPDVTAPAAGAATASADYAGSSTPNLPLQCAVVCSLRTPINTRRGRGRVYWPAVGLTVTAAGKLNLANAPSLQTNFRTMFTEIANAWPETGELDLAVVSKVGDTVTPVTQLRVGDVIDTQRRRRDALVEVYQSVVYPA